MLESNGEERGELERDCATALNKPSMDSLFFFPERSQKNQGRKEKNYSKKEYSRGGQGSGW